MVTYSDMIQFCILLVTLVGLCYGKKIAAITSTNDGCLKNNCR